MKRLCMPAHQTNRLNSQACLDALKRNHPILLRVHSRRRVVRHAATATARRDPFETLGIPRSASLKEVKKAYRKRALKLHPDVNKQPNAREQFMECKNAYLEIVDALERDASRSWGGTSFRDKAAARSDRARGTTRSSASSSAETEFYGLGKSCVRLVTHGRVFAWWFRTLFYIYDVHSEWFRDGMLWSWEVLGEELKRFQNLPRESRHLTLNSYTLKPHP